jgi:DNA gyrase subunit A
VIEIKRGEVPQVVLNQLYKHTPMQSSISILMLALLDNRPLVFTLRQMLEEFLYHRKQVVYKRAVFDMAKARAREHILEGFIIALRNIDELVALIKNRTTSDEAHG